MATAVYPCKPVDHSLAVKNEINIAGLANEPFIASSVALGFGGQIQEIAAEEKFIPKVIGRAPDILPF